ncbi:MAG: hypothetical protein IPJ40_03830 [Saprospirales bacterium]|nr:hypothetical protein [Saprospirales bacterium]
MVNRCLLFTALLTAALLPAQTLIPFQGYKDLYGYATEDGQVVIKPVHKASLKSCPPTVFTVCATTARCRRLTRRGSWSRWKTGTMWSPKSKMCGP